MFCMQVQTPIENRCAKNYRNWNKSRFCRKRKVMENSLRNKYTELLSVSFLPFSDGYSTSNYRILFLMFGIVVDTLVEKYCAKNYQDWIESRLYRKPKIMENFFQNKCA